MHVLKCKAVYLLPIWIDIESEHPDATMHEINDALQEALEGIAQNATMNGGTIDVSWSITERVNLEEKNHGMRYM